MKIDGGDGIREAADPVVVEFGERYYLFASKSSGYWHTEDFVEWTRVLIDDTVLPIEDYAPRLFVYDGYLYVGSTHGKGMLYRSSAPEKGEWGAGEGDMVVLGPRLPGRGRQPLPLLRLFARRPDIHAHARPAHARGEARRDGVCFNSDKGNTTAGSVRANTTSSNAAPIEGAWMTAHDGHYYLQYAARAPSGNRMPTARMWRPRPRAHSPIWENSPVSYKPTGFLGGVGHGCLFTVGDDNYWKAATNSISVRHMFRAPRVVPTPLASMTTDTCMPTPIWAITRLTCPTAAVGGRGKARPRVDAPLAGQACDGLVGPRRLFCRQGCRRGCPHGMGGRLERRRRVVRDRPGGRSRRFAPYRSTSTSTAPRTRASSGGLYQSYVIYASVDGETWYAVADRSGKRSDTPHDYIEFEKPFKARYVKLQNVAYTVSQNLSLRDLRALGRGRAAGRRPPTALRCSARCRRRLPRAPVVGCGEGCAGLYRPLRHSARQAVQQLPGCGR